MDVPGLLTWLSANGHLGSFHLLAVGNNAAENMRVRALCGYLISLGEMRGRGMRSRRLTPCLMFEETHQLFSKASVPFSIPSLCVDPQRPCAGGSPGCHLACCGGSLVGEADFHHAVGQRCPVPGVASVFPCAY